MYYCKVSEDIDNGPSAWNSQKLQVFKWTDNPWISDFVGSYVRNYPSFGVETFASFEQDGQWYALISDEYTRVACIELPSMEIISSTPGGSSGFCPVEIWVPQYYEHSHEKYGKFRIYDNDLDEFDTSEDREWTYIGPYYESFALYSGCIWGDDHSWKVQAIDISDPHNIKELRPFGYTELATDSSIRDIKIDWENGEYLFNIPTKSQFGFISGIDDPRYIDYKSYDK